MIEKSSLCLNGWKEARRDPPGRSLHTVTALKSTVLNGKASDSSMVYCIDSGRLHLGMPLPSSWYFLKHWEKRFCNSCTTVRQLDISLGVAKTLSRVRERFYWVQCGCDVQEWCRNCDVCAQREAHKDQGTNGKIQCWISYGAHCYRCTGPTACHWSRKQIHFNSRRLFHQMGWSISYGQSGSLHCGWNPGQWSCLSFWGTPIDSFRPRPKLWVCAICRDVSVTQH